MFSSLHFHYQSDSVEIVCCKLRETRKKQQQWVFKIP
ncbi:hypothetical protein C5167_003776 [Papaver somniferum]|uniref:Uncharacterized protein n=1 Tax=Papaver somniferum TaxID=3469 RepID=A0A4Y7L4J4_PAPSO|nr:hypothetical protein C5167_003776 [Papaver somniferum]